MLYIYRIEGQRNNREIKLVTDAKSIKQATAIFGELYPGSQLNTIVRVCEATAESLSLLLAQPSLLNKH